jgi:hypothetical protein
MYFYSICIYRSIIEVVWFSIFFFLDLRKSHPRKVYFVSPGERIKPRLSQALTRGARRDSNSRPAVQISSPLPLRYVSWDLVFHLLNLLIEKAYQINFIFF